MPAPLPATQPRRTLVFIDWDDTLLSSTWLSQQGLLRSAVDPSTPLPAPVVLELNKLDQAATALIDRILLTEQVCLLTNSEEGWIQMSAKRFLPGLYCRLKDVEQCSARSLFEHKYPFSPCLWKVFAMEAKLSAWLMDETVSKHVISIGDSPADREALLAVCRGHAHMITKVVKLVEQPSVDALIRQVKLITQSIRYVIDHDTSLDMMLKVSGPAAAETGADETN